MRFDPAFRVWFGRLQHAESRGRPHVLHQQCGCTPDLQSPDCPAVAAEDCPEKACTTGCLDFYLCTTSGWKAVAYCDEDGSFAQAPD